MGAKKIYTDEEREQKKKDNYFLVQKPKEKEMHQRLASVRIDGGGKLSKKDRIKFKEEVKEINSRRFEQIIKNQKMWERINTTSDEWADKKARAERRKRNGKGVWVKDKEIERAERVIWGGYKEKIFEDEGEEEPKEFINPYKPINEEE